MTSPEPQLSPEPQTPFRLLSFLLVSPLGRTKPTREQTGSVAPTNRLCRPLTPVPARPSPTPASADRGLRTQPLVTALEGSPQGFLSPELAKLGKRRSLCLPSRVPARFQGAGPAPSSAPSSESDGRAQKASAGLQAPGAAGQWAEGGAAVCFWVLGTRIGLTSRTSALGRLHAANGVREGCGQRRRQPGCPNCSGDYWVRASGTARRGSS